MRRFEAKEDRLGGELVERCEEVEAQHCSLFAPTLLTLGASRKKVVGSGNVRTDLVRLIEERHCARQEPAEVPSGNAARTTTVRTAGVAEMVMRKFVTEDEGELLINQQRLASQLTRVVVFSW